MSSHDRETDRREHCPNGGGEPRISAAILERAVIEKILTHLVALAPARETTALHAA